MLRPAGWGTDLNHFQRAQNVPFWTLAEEGYGGSLSLETDLESVCNWPRGLHFVLVVCWACSKYQERRTSLQRYWARVVVFFSPRVSGNQSIPACSRLLLCVLRRHDWPYCEGLFKIWNVGVLGFFLVFFVVVVVGCCFFGVCVCVCVCVRFCCCRRRRCRNCCVFLALAITVTTSLKGLGLPL